MSDRVKREASVPLAKGVGTILKVVAGLLAGLVLLTLLSAIYLADLSKTLPDLEIDEDGLSSPQTSIVFAADGTVLAEWHGEEDRTAIGYDDMPIHLRDAVVAIEDRRFWDHQGVDTEGIARALRVNTQTGEIRQGGSTITQQLVKILFTDGERTVTRKIREALLAYELEAKTDKSKVLETYLNTVYFGNGAYGVESAAKRYFGKKAASLTLAESALLAGVIRSPSRFDPTNAPEQARKRRDLVLREMHEQGYIDDKARSGAQREDISLAPPKDAPLIAPYFVEYVKQDLIDRLGAEKVFGGGLRVHTTLEPAVQRLAEKSSRILARRSDPEVALVAIRHADGSVLAMVGGRDFRTSQFNLAAQGKRQPGSAFKTFVLVTALEQGVRPQQVFSAAPYSVPVKDGVWHVQNYENKRTQGSVSLQAATRWSVNAVYARLIMQVGPEKVARTAKRLGITTKVNADPAIALGGLSQGVSPLEMASAYGTIAGGGLRVRPSGIVKVTDDSGELVYEPDRSAERVMEKSVAVKTSLLLHDVIEQGTGTAARVSTWAAGKTGTTQSYRDAWFVGWTEDVSTAVWVGYPDAQVAMTNVGGHRVTGGSYPARIWSQFMEGAAGERSAALTPAPAGGEQVVVSICQDSMRLANARCPNRVDIYLSPELVPKDACGIH